MLFLKKILFISIIGICSLQGFAQKKTTKTKLDPVLQFAQQQIEQKSYLAAISTLKNFIDTHPNTADAWYLLGNCYTKLERKQDAETAYGKVLALKPKAYQINQDMGNIYKSQKKYDVALQYYNAAIAENDTSPNLYSNRGMCYYYLGAFELALKDFNAVVKLNPKDYIGYNNLGSATYSNQNIAAASVADLKKAEGYFKKALELKPDFELTNRNIGIVHYFLNDFEHAYKELFYATQLDPKDENAQFNLGRVLYKQKNYPVAIQFFDNAIKLVNYNAEYYIQRGICKVDNKDIKGAEKDFYQARQLSNNTGDAEFQMARIHAYQNNKNQMIDALKNARDEGLFKDTKYFSIIAKDECFQKFSKDKDFIKTIQDIKFGK